MAHFHISPLSPPQNNSISPSDSLRTTSEKHRGSSDYSLDSKKRKVEDKDSMSRYVSDVTWTSNKRFLCNKMLGILTSWHIVFSGQWRRQKWWSGGWCFQWGEKNILCWDWEVIRNWMQIFKFNLCFSLIQMKCHQLFLVYMVLYLTPSCNIFAL